MKLWSDFFEYFLDDVPGCSLFTATNALRSATQEFCDRTKAWRVTMDPVTTVAGNSVYPFDITADQEVTKVLSAELDGHPIELLLQDQIESSRRGMIVLDERQFFLQPLPATGNILVIKAALRPSNTAAGVDDIIWSSYAEKLAYGAKARLFRKESKPYSDPAAADLNMAQFNAAIGDTIVRSAKAFSSAPLRTRASFF